MPVKTLTVDFKGRKIVVRNTWFSGATLLIDGEVVDRNGASMALDPGMSFLSHRIEIDGQSHLIEVFAKAIFTVKLKICVNKEQIAGDMF